MAHTKGKHRISKVTTWGRLRDWLNEPLLVIEYGGVRVRRVK